MTCLESHSSDKTKNMTYCYEFTAVHSFSGTLGQHLLKTHSSNIIWHKWHKCHYENRISKRYWKKSSFLFPWFLPNNFFFKIPFKIPHAFICHLSLGSSWLFSSSLFFHVRSSWGSSSLFFHIRSSWGGIVGFLCTGLVSMFFSWDLDFWEEDHRGSHIISIISY